MKAQLLFCLGAIIATIPGPLAEPLAMAKGVRLKSTSPVCPLVCPKDYVPALFTWELHPGRTIYDEQGNTKVAPDAVWPVSCMLRCEHRVFNEETKVWNDKKLLCNAAAEPAPYRGPWRHSGQFGMECASTYKNGCGMQCYIAPPASRKTKK
jgi:hypothetical protein